MRYIVGNPCGHGNCKSSECEKCYYWSPCLYIGKKYKQVNLPKWNWLIEFLYKTQHYFRG